MGNLIRTTAVGCAARSRFQPHLRQPVAQRVAREAQHPRGLALVAVGAAQRLADDLLLVLIERHALGQEVRLALRAGAGGRGALSSLMSAASSCVPAHITRLRSITFSSSRTLPGQW